MDGSVEKGFVQAQAGACGGSRAWPGRGDIHEHRRDLEPAQPRTNTGHLESPRGRNPSFRDITLGRASAQDCDRRMRRGGSVEAHPCCGLGGHGVEGPPSARKGDRNFDGLFLRWAGPRAASSGRSRIPEACVGKAGLARRLPGFLPHPFTDVALRRTRRDHHSGRRRRSSRTRRSVSVSQSPRARENGTVR